MIFFLLLQLCLDGISFFFRLKQDVWNCLETGQTTRGFCLYNKFFGFLGPKLLHRHQAPSHSIDILLRFVLGSEKDNKKWTQAIWDPKHQQLIWLEPQNKATYIPKCFFPFHRIVKNKSSKSLWFPWQKQDVHSLNEFISLRLQPAETFGLLYSRHESTATRDTNSMLLTYVESLNPKVARIHQRQCICQFWKCHQHNEADALISGFRYQMCALLSQIHSRATQDTG